MSVCCLQMNKRTLFLIGAPILALVLVVALLFAVSGSAQQSPAHPDDTSAALDATLLSAPSTTVKPAQPATPTAALLTLAPAAPADTPAADADLVVLVDGKALRTERLAFVQAVDQVMSALVGSEPATPAQLIDQMINHALVAQQMTAAELSDPAAAAEAATRLETLLSADDKATADLTRALEDAGIDPSQFEDYFAELLAVDAFARQAATAEGSELEAYIGDLQTAARISYGPAGALALESAVSAAQTSVATPTASPAVQTPAPTLEAQSSSPADAPPAIPRGVVAGLLAPDFTLDTLGEETQTTFDDLLGRPTVLSFWTTWCPYCLRQTPILVAAAERYTDDLHFVGVDVAEDADAVAAYVAEHAIPYPVLLDRQSQAATAYAVNGFPTTYFLDATGTIVAQHIGALSEEELTQYVEQLLTPRS